MKTKRERRMIRGKVECRALTDKEKSDGYIGALVGVIPLNTDSVELRDRRLNGGDPFVERIAPKAFAEASDVMGMAGHTDDTLAAFARQGVNLTLTESDAELRWEALVPDTTAGRDLLVQARLGIVRGTSFEFDYGAEDKWEKRSDGVAVRTVTRGRLSAVNPVVWPAYDDSELSVSMRGARAAAEARGYYYGEIVDWSDPTVTPDTKFAAIAMSRATYALTDALEYLRAAPAGALADFAKAEAGVAAENAKTLIDWLVANGAAVNPAAVQRATEKLTEARAALGAQKPAENFQPDYDRERRARIISLSSR